MLYDTRLGLIALVLSGFFAGMALNGGSHAAWTASACFAAAAVANVFVDWSMNRTPNATSRDDAS